MRQWIAIVVVATCIAGACVFAVMSRTSEPVLTVDQIIEIRTKQVAWLRAEPGCTQLKDSVDKVAGKYTPAGYLIQDGPDGLRLIKATPEKPKK